MQIQLEKCSSPEKSFLSKQVYVEDKIKGEINSEKVFNSPKCMNSPGIAKTPTNVTFAIKDFFNNSNEKQKIKQIMNSPRIRQPQYTTSSTKQSPRRKSPQPPSVTPASANNAVSQ